MKATIEKNKPPITIHYFDGPQASTTLCGRDLYAHRRGSAGPVVTLDQRRVTCSNCLRALDLIEDRHIPWRNLQNNLEDDDQE